MSRRVGTSTPGRFARYGLALLLGLGAVGLIAAPAQAHNFVVGTSPAADSTITEQPGQIVVTTNDALIDTGVGSKANTMTVVGPDGLYYGDGCAVVQGPAVLMPAELGVPGRYTVTWQVVSTDGHPVSQNFGFEWQPGAEQSVGVGSDQVPSCGEVPGSGAVAKPSPSAEAVGPNVKPHTQTMDDIGWIVAAIGIVLVGGLVLLVLLLRQRRRADLRAEEETQA